MQVVTKISSLSEQSESLPVKHIECNVNIIEAAFHLGPR